MTPRRALRSCPACIWLRFATLRCISLHFAAWSLPGSGRRKNCHSCPVLHSMIVHTQHPCSGSVMDTKCSSSP
ncbi:hypothetical protein M3J09_011173 [Ascochyta lentis]